MGRSLGRRGPGARGSSPHCAAAVRCPVPAGLSEAQGPAAPAPPPSALPRRGPAPPRPPFPPQGPGHSLCKRRPLKLRAPYPTEALISGLAHSALLGAETGLEARTKGQRAEHSGTGTKPEGTDGCAGRLCTPALSYRERGEGSDPQPPGHFCAQRGGWTRAPSDGGRKLASRSQGWLQLSKGGALQQPRDLTWGSRDHICSPHPPKGQAQFLPREGQQGHVSLPKPGSGGTLQAQLPQTAPRPRSAAAHFAVGVGGACGEMAPLPSPIYPGGPTLKPVLQAAALPPQSWAGPWCGAVLGWGGGLAGRLCFPVCMRGSWL